jgi:3-deoxy-7-phosphoheptulonate synthase
MKQWSPSSWQDYEYRQAATYPDEGQLQKAVDKLSTLPPLVTSGEIKKLKSQLAMAATGQAFILQGGDCAESFAECQSNGIANKLKILLQMSLILLHGLHKPIIRLGRIAGQYAKPRSANFETKNGIELPSYRGDLVNCPEFTKEKRIPNPKRLLQGYSCSAMTLNFIRGLVAGGFADLHNTKQWDLSFFEHSEMADEFHAVVQNIEDTLDFLDSINGLKASNLNRIDFFTSHEALHLHYEQALTRKVKDGLWYDLSTHFPWIGMRTATLDSAHIEYFKGINNPIGIKVGPSANPDWLKQIIETLNPENEAGRLTLITRFGCEKILESLPPLIEAANKTGITVVWSCDPMHGNTHATEDGIKTRHFDDILTELRRAFKIHQEMDSHLGGVHFELTGDNVTECIGGARGLDAQDLKHAYKSLVDPRLNYEQSLEMAIQIAQDFKKKP